MTKITTAMTVRAASKKATASTNSHVALRDFFSSPIAGKIVDAPLPATLDR